MPTREVYHKIKISDVLDAVCTSVSAVECIPVIKRQHLLKGKIEETSVDSNLYK